MLKKALSRVDIIDEYIVNLEREMDNLVVIPITRHMARSIGFLITEESMIATLASELATNVIRYAKKGSLTVRIVRQVDIPHKLGIEIDANDKGPGIQNIELALKDNYSTTENSLGLGLPSVYRYMDEFYINDNQGIGTHIVVRKWYSI